MGPGAFAPCRGSRLAHPQCLTLRGREKGPPTPRWLQETPQGSSPRIPSFEAPRDPETSKPHSASCCSSGAPGRQPRTELALRWERFLPGPTPTPERTLSHRRGWKALAASPAAHFLLAETGCAQGSAKPGTYASGPGQPTCLEAGAPQNLQYLGRAQKRDTPTSAMPGVPPEGAAPFYPMLVTPGFLPLT